MPRLSVPTPLGVLTLSEDDGALSAIDWGDTGTDRTPLLIRAADQILAYFAGGLQLFELPLRPGGDAFQQRVNMAMAAIPFGETRTYGEIAESLGSMPQPVGNACGRNTIPIVIPCHRVVGTGGLGGFSAPGGVETKVALLRHEGAYSLLI